MYDDEETTLWNKSVPIVFYWIFNDMTSCSGKYVSQVIKASSNDCNFDFFFNQILDLLKVFSRPQGLVVEIKCAWFIWLRMCLPYWKSLSGSINYRLDTNLEFKDVRVWSREGYCDEIVKFKTIQSPFHLSRIWNFELFMLKFQTELLGVQWIEETHPLQNWIFIPILP